MFENVTQEGLLLFMLGITFLYILLISLELKLVRKILDSAEGMKQ